MKKKINVREFLYDDTLDLSMCDLQEVPVKEIAAIPKATTLDLSCNSISSLPPIFATSLIHLTHLDLSRNQLIELPENFGSLVNLKHLDLFKNQLKTVPLGFGSLKSLKWLDLKENPLLPKIKQVIGQCDDHNLCQSAAIGLVNFMKDLQTKVEKEKSRREQLLKEEQENMEKKEKQKNNFTRNNQAKKNKFQTKNQTNGRMTEDIVMTQTVSQKKISNVKPSKKKGPGLFLRILGAMFKFFLYLTLFSLLTIFVISMIDEPTYHNMKVKVTAITKSVSSRLPVEVVDGFNKGLAVTIRFVRLVGERVIYISGVAFETGSKYYEIISNNESVQIYAETFRHYCHVAYIKTSEVASSVSTELRSFVKRIYQ